MLNVSLRYFLFGLKSFLDILNFLGKNINKIKIDVNSLIILDSIIKLTA